MAAGLGVGGIKTVLSITARTNAVGRFAALSKGILGSNNALSRFARSAVITTGVMSGLGFMIKSLMNPVTGIIALASIGLAVVRWERYQHAITNTRLQMALLGQAAGTTSQRIESLRAIVGTGMATAIMRAGSSILNLSTHAAADIARLTRDMEIAGVDNAAENMEILSKAITTGKIEDLKEALAVWGLTIDDIKTVDELTRKLREETPVAGAGGGLESLKIERERLSDAATDIMGPTKAAGTSALAYLLELVVDFPIVIWDTIKAGLLLQDPVRAFIDGLARLIFPNQKNLETEARAFVTSLYDSTVAEFPRALEGTAYLFLGYIFDDEIAIQEGKDMWTAVFDSWEVAMPEWIASHIIGPFGLSSKDFAAVLDSDWFPVFVDWLGDVGSSAKYFFQVTFPGFIGGMAFTIKSAFYDHFTVPVINMINEVIDKANEYLPKRFELDHMGIPDRPVYKQWVWGGDRIGAGEREGGPLRHGQSFGRKGSTFGAPSWRESLDDPGVQVKVYIGDHEVEALVENAVTGMMRKSGVNNPLSMISI